MVTFEKQILEMIHELKESLNILPVTKYIRSKSNTHGSAEPGVRKHSLYVYLFCKAIAGMGLEMNILKCCQVVTSHNDILKKTIFKKNP